MTGLISEAVPLQWYLLTIRKTSLGTMYEVTLNDAKRLVTTLYGSAKNS